MGFFGYSIIILLNLFQRKKTLIQKLLLFLMLIFMALLFIGGDQNADYLNYYNAYQTQFAATFESGFVLLMKILHGFGLSYEMFLLTVFLIGIGLRLLFIKNVSNTNYVMALFLLFPFILETVQIRTFLATSIIIFSMRYLLFERRGNVLKYLLCVSIACTIHNLSFLFFPLVLIKFKNIRKLIKIIPPITVVIIIYLYYNNFSISFIQSLTESFDSNRASLYITGGFTRTYILNFIYIMINLLLSRWSLNILSRNENNLLDKNNNLEVAGKINYINIILFIYFPLYLLSGVFFRIPRGMYVLNYVLFSMTRDKIQRGSNLSYLYNILIVLYLIFVFFFELYVQRSTEVLYPIIFDNKFF